MSAESAAGAVYLDSSAIVRLVVREFESDALRAFLVNRPVRVTSALARVEVPRAVRSQGRTATARATQALSGVSVLALDEALLNDAARINADHLRSLDAIHIASAQQVGPELAALITYDTRMATAARALGLPVVAPT